MSERTADLIITIIILASTAILIIANKVVASLNISNDVPAEYVWIIHGLSNAMGYATILIPGYLVFKYIKVINYFDKFTSSFISQILKKCFSDDELIDRTNSSVTKKLSRTAMHEAVLLLIYFLGLQASFLSWGVLQEKIMTMEYINFSKNVGRFKDSQFLVFVNRILAFCISGIVVLCKSQPRHRCPLYKYAFCSLSNIFSSWCQYEALKYVSFIHQVLAKAAKTIPVMIMGKIVSKTKYELYEYITAVMLSVGMLFFMVDAGNDKKSTITTFAGIILLCSYIAFDSFTSNWQGALFKQFAMSPVQMMCAVNLFSGIFTAISLLQQNCFTTSLNFMLDFPQFASDCILLSICSASGQLFIFYTLSDFGPVVFAIISTIRQGFSVLLSCLIYGHEINWVGIFGICLVFFSILLRIYCSHRIKVLRSNVSARSNY